MANRHKAYKDMRLTEITKPPRHQRDKLNETDRTPVHLRQRRKERGVRRVDQLCSRPETTEHHRRPHRNYENRKEHHHALYEVRTRYGKKTSNQCIEDNHACAGKERRQIGQLEDRLKKATRRYKSRRRIEDKEDQNKDRRHNAQRTRCGKEAILKEIRQRQ